MAAPKTTPTNAQTMAKMESSHLLPAPVAQEVWKQATEQSVIQKVAGSIAMPITGGSIYTHTGELVAGVVGEGELKPIGSTTGKMKSFKPIKVALVTYMSKEATQANKLASYDLLTENFAQAIALAIDMAVIHGRDAKANKQIPGAEYLTQSTNVVQLGQTAANKGGLATEFLNGYTKLAEKGYDMSGFIADRTMRTTLMGQLDVNGRPIYQNSLDLKSGIDNMFGLPVAYSKAVKGVVGAHTKDTKLRAIGGDFKDNLRLGFVESIQYSKTDQATIVDGDSIIPLWQMNMEAYLVEAQFGWVIRDKDAFVMYADAAAVDEADS